MDFTYKDYDRLLGLLSGCGYTPCGYNEYERYEKCVILRHDIDQSPAAALKFAELEAKKGVCSTYFVLLNTDFYNAASKTQRDRLLAIHAMGHHIGLHFDETQYPGADVCGNIRREADILSDILGIDISLVSMHRPSRETLEADYRISGMINSYSKLFFKSFKYLSDSRCFWREPAEEIISSGTYDRLHILTHPFWYSEKNRTAAEAIREFVNGANAERFEIMSRNVRDMGEFMVREQVK